jgi:DNA-directed RNA polymerase specialized sigma24 family protein
MRNLSSHWEQYVAIQANLDRSTVVDDAAWGREFALNHLLAAGESTRPEAVERAARSESRRERYRAAIRRRHQPVVAEMTNMPGPMLEARQQLQLLKAQLTVTELALMTDVGDGSSYLELAARTGVTEGAFRVRAQRTRVKVLRLLAA